MAERIPIAIVGCGGMGRRHLRGLARLYRSAMNNLELVAVCDLSQANADRLADEALDLLGARPRVFADVAAMVRAIPELQAADVTTDTGSHHVVATACLEAGLHVLCEKPIAVTLRGANRMIETARRKRRVLSVAENYRRDPINRLVRALLDDGAIGQPRLMIETSIGGGDRIAITPWRHMKQTGSMPIDMGVHLADMLRYFMGEVGSVYGQSRLHEPVRRNSGSAGPGGYYAAWSSSFPDTIEATGDDAIYAQVTFRSGAVGQWTYDNAGHGRPVRARQIFGATGSIDCPGDRSGRPVRLDRDDGTVIDDARVLELAPSYRLEPLAAELYGGERVWSYQSEFQENDARLLALEYHELGECVLRGRQPEVTGEEARLDLALAYAPFESGRLGRPVTLDDLIAGRASVYQDEVDRMIGLVAGAAV